MALIQSILVLESWLINNRSKWLIIKIQFILVGIENTGPI